MKKINYVIEDKCYYIKDDNYERKIANLSELSKWQQDCINCVLKYKHGKTRSEDVSGVRQLLIDAGFELERVSLATYDGYRAAEISSMKSVKGKKMIRLWTEKSKRKGIFNYIFTEVWSIDQEIFDKAMRLEKSLYEEFL